MARYGQTVYERELKGILSGEKKTIDAFIAGLPEEEKEGYECARRIPFVVVRAAGSFGVDLIALRGEFSFPIEVKASASRRIHMSRDRRLKDQYTAFLRLCAPAHVLPLYAMRLKGVRNIDPWRIFASPVDNLPPRLKTILNHIPAFILTASGNPVLDWDSGLKLSKFLQYLEYMSR